MSESTLKPCPFCGSEAVLTDRNKMFRTDGIHTNGPAWPVVGCPKCFVYFSAVDLVGARKHERTIEAWNTRADEWVPVSEKRPPEGVEVSVWNTEFGMRRDRIHVHADDSWGWRNYDKKRNTHWQLIVPPRTEVQK